jgi:transcriptional regulator with XRE-family HTH domain
VESLEQVKKLREEYERALDAAESRRVAYHQAVLDLYHSGTPLREIAKELGLSHQRVHQIVSGEPPPRNRKLGRAAGGIGAALLLVAATFGALRLAHAPPFGQSVSVVPAVIYQTEGPAAPVSRPARPQQGRSVPIALFKANPQGRMNSGAGIKPKSIWDQKVIPASVRHAASVHIPAVGPVAFWYGRARQGGWCAGLRLRNGDWLGTNAAHFLHLGPGGRSVGMGGGEVPGCFATQQQMHTAAKRRYAPTGFECGQGEIDARRVGELWQIRYGLITAPGAVKVRDRVSGRSTNVVGRRFFLLAIRHPRRHVLPMHLVATDKAGNVVANGRSAFGC